MAKDKETIEELNAIRLEQGLKPYKISSKGCLKCLNSFDSWGSHNRICGKCKGLADANDYSSYSFDPEANFQYDLTVSQILDITQHKGLELDWNTYYTKGGNKKT